MFIGFRVLDFAYSLFESNSRFGLFTGSNEEVKP